MLGILAFAGAVGLAVFISVMTARARSPRLRRRDDAPILGGDDHELHLPHHHHDDGDAGGHH